MEVRSTTGSLVYAEVRQWPPPGQDNRSATASS
jgi:hypothetical protein